MSILIRPHQLQINTGSCGNIFAEDYLFNSDKNSDKTLTSFTANRYTRSAIANMRNMFKSVLHSKRIEAFQLVSIPAGFALITPLLFLLITRDSKMSYSILLGGLVWLIPNLYFAVKVFTTGKAKITPSQLLKNFYQAEVVKLTLCAILFIAIVKFLPIAMLPLLIGYGIAQVVFWFSPFLLNTVSRLTK